MKELLERAGYKESPDQTRWLDRWPSESQDIEGWLEQAQMEATHGG